MMRAIRNKFDKICRGHSEWSSLTCFAYAVAGEKLTFGEVKRLFNSLVSKEDYAPKDKDRILKDLLQLTRK